MALLSTLRHIASDWRAAQSEARTRRLIAGLPPELRKDIGWPDADGVTRPNPVVSARISGW